MTTIRPNVKYVSGGSIASLVLTLTLPTPASNSSTVIYDFGCTALVAGDTVSLAIKQGAAFLLFESTGINNDPAVSQIRIDHNSLIAPQIPWLAFGAPATALAVVLVVLTPLTSGTLFAVYEEVPLT